MTPASIPRRPMWVALFATAALALVCGRAWALPAASSASDAPAGLTADDLALIINENDPLSVQIGDYYQKRRAIPATNVIRVQIRVAASMNRAEFAKVWSEVRARVPTHVQVLALAWSQPFRVDCMAITSAFAYGFDEKSCTDGCQPTPFSPYFDSPSRAPYKQFGLRPTMLIAARSFNEARALIDRGVASDASAPHGTAYLLDTSDPNRNKRAVSFGYAQALAGNGLGVQVIKSDVLRDRADVMFYFTGVVRVAALRSNKFLPGALADHLTSAGGVLDGSAQMTSLEWLEAGATASYGTVVEPCNYPGKFPNIPLVMRHYLNGETAIEAYWKSVLMPAQGLFIGEPLAAPYRAQRRAGSSDATQPTRATGQ